MRTMLKNTVALLLLLPLLAGTLGISAREHFCSSSKKTTVKLFPEISGQLASCCCSSESPVTGSTDGTASESLDSQACCRTVQLYFRAGFQTVFTEESVQPSSAPEADLRIPDGLKLQETPANKILTFYTDTGPPLSGRQRVITYHQSKIPFPVLLLS